MSEAMELHDDLRPPFPCYLWDSSAGYWRYFRDDPAPFILGERLKVYTHWMAPPPPPPARPDKGEVTCPDCGKIYQDHICRGVPLSVLHKKNLEDMNKIKKPHWICICGKEGFRLEGESFSDHIRTCGGFSTVKAVFDMKTEAYDFGYKHGFNTKTKVSWRDLYPFSSPKLPCLLRSNKKGSLPFTCYSEDDLYAHVKTQEEMKVYLQYLELPE